MEHDSTGAGDHVELLAQVGVVASLNPCGDDLFGSSAFEVAPVRARARVRRRPSAPLLVPARSGPSASRGRSADPGVRPRGGSSR